MPEHLGPLVEPGPPLAPAQLARWSRHLLLPQVGEVGQRRLLNARVLVVGAGGLGSPVLQYLAAAGVGRLGIVDDDRVEASNLQRQVIHGVADLGRLKAESARDAVARINPDTAVTLYPERLTAATAALIDGWDIVVDGTDNFATRYFVSDECARRGLPVVWGAVFRFDAQVSVFWGRPPAGCGIAGVTLRDVFPTAPPVGALPSCAEAGVLGAMCGQAGAMMAAEVIKLVTGIGQPLIGRIALVDVLGGRVTELPFLPAGGPVPPEHAEAGSEPSDACPAGAPGVRVPSITAAELAALHADDGSLPPDVALLDVRRAEERAAFALPGSLWVPLDEIVSGAGLAQVPEDRRVVVYCHSGVRSLLAARLLDAAGRDVADLEGGLLAWWALPVRAGGAP